MRYGVLGPLVVVADERPIPLGGATQRWILAALLADAGSAVPVPELAARVWGPEPPPDSSGTLSRALDQLDLVLGDGALTLDDDAVALRAEDVDALEFGSLASRARALLADGDAHAADLHLTSAQRLWRGQPYVEFAHAPFAAREAARLGSLLDRVRTDQVATGIALGQGSAVVPLAREVVRRTPGEERAWSQLAVALHRAGDRAAAIRTCQEGARHATSAAELTELERRIERSDPTLMTPDPFSARPESGVPVSRALLLVDLVGSTRLWAMHPHAMTGAMAAYQAVAGQVLTAAGGRLPPDQGEGDSRLAVFDDAVAAARGAAELTTRLAAQTWPDDMDLAARMAVHVGDVVESGGNVYGESVNRTARLRAIGHGGQVLLSATAAAVVEGSSLSLRSLGVARLRDIAEAQEVWQLEAPGLRQEFPPLRLESASRVPLRLDPDAPCPYLGLAAYGEDDVELFAGRERLTAELAAELVDHDLVVVVGPSGAGKSSIVHAGLLPSLRSGALPGSRDWSTAVTTPGTDPVASLPREAPDILVLDQAEELFTLADHDSRAKAATRLAELLATGTRVVLVIRGDFYGRLAELPGLSRRVGAATVLVGAPGDDDLRRVVEEPAARVGLVTGEGLVEAVVADVRGNPAALPLLSTALVRTWAHREGAALTLDAYRAGGGVVGAIEQLAESTYSGLDDAGQAAARRLLVRLAQDEDGVWVRRPALVSEVAPGNDVAATEALRTLTASRLVAVDRDRVQLAHEAVLTSWPRLAAWLEEQRDSLATLAALATATRQWEAGGRSAADLARGPRLVAAVEVAERSPAELTVPEREYVAESSAESQRELTEARGRADREERGRRRLRVVAAGLAAALVCTAVLGGVAVSSSRRAAVAALTADAERVGAEARNVDDRSLGLLLAAAGQQLEDSAATRSNLLAALETFDGTRSTLSVGYPVLSLARGLDDRVDLVTVQNTASTWSISTGRPIEYVAPEQWPIVAIATDAAARPVIVQQSAPGSAEAQLWISRDAALTEGWSPLPGPVSAQAPAWADDRVIAASGTTVLSYPTAASDRTPVRTDLGRPVTAVAATASLAAAVSGTATDWHITLLDPVTLGVRRDLRTSAPSGGATEVPASIAVTPDGAALAVGYDSGRVEVVPASATALASGPFAAPHHTATVVGLAFDATGQLLASGGDDGLAVVQRRRDGLVVQSASVGSAVRGLAFDRLGTSLHVGTDGGKVVTLDVDPLHALAPVVGGLLPAWQEDRLVLSGDGRSLASLGYAADGASSAIGAQPTTGGEVRSAAMTPNASDPPGAFLNPRGLVLSADGARALVLADRIGDPGRHELVTTWTLSGPASSARVDLPDLTDAADGPSRPVLTPDGASLVWFQRTGTTAVLRGVSLDPLAAEPDVRLSGAVTAGSRAWWPIRWRADGRTLLAACGVGCFAEVDRESGQVRRLVDVPDPRTGVGVVTTAVSPDGTHVVEGVDDGTLRWFAADDLAPTTPWVEAHGNRMVSTSFTPDGTALLTGGNDGAMALWRTDDGSRIGLALPIGASEAEPTSVVALADGTALALDGVGRVRAVPTTPERWHALACTVAGRDLTSEEWARYLPGREYRPTCP